MNTNKKQAYTHNINCPYNTGHDCECGEKTATHSIDCEYNIGHDCNCAMSNYKTESIKINQKIKDVSNILATAKQFNDVELAEAAEKMLSQLKDNVNEEPMTAPQLARRNSLNSRARSSEPTSTGYIPSKSNSSPSSSSARQITHEDNEGVDTLEMDVALFIRCLEWAKEDAADDVALHKFAENALAKNSILTMDDYDMLVPQGEITESKGGWNQHKGANVTANTKVDPGYKTPEEKQKERFKADIQKRNQDAKDVHNVKEDATGGASCSGAIAAGPAQNLFAQPIKRIAKKKTKKSAIGQGVYESEIISELDDRPTDNFGAEDLKQLERITDLPALRARALALISTKSKHQMKPEKVEWFKRNLEQKNNKLAIIKMMYDLLLAGEGHKVVGSRNSMKQNSYRAKFGEGIDTTDDIVEMKRRSDDDEWPEGHARSRFNADGTRKDKFSTPKDYGKVVQPSSIISKPGSDVIQAGPLKDVKEGAVKNNQAKVRWMQRFETNVVAGDKKHTGKIDWNSATHLFNLGKDPVEAAEQYVKNRIDEIQMKPVRSYKVGGPDDPATKAKLKAVSGKESRLSELREEPIEWENLGWSKIQQICEKNHLGLGGEIVDIIYSKKGFINIAGNRISAVKLTVYVEYDPQDFGYEGGEKGTSDAINITLYRDPNKPSVIKAKY